MKGNRRTVRTGPKFRVFLRQLAETRGWSASDAARYVLVLGIGGTHQEASAENEIMSARRGSIRDVVAELNEGVEFDKVPAGHRAPEEADDYPMVSTRLSPGMGTRLETWIENSGLTNAGDALRAAYEIGGQKMGYTP